MNYEPVADAQLKPYPRGIVFSDRDTSVALGGGAVVQADDWIYWYKCNSAVKENRDVVSYPGLKLT